MESGIIISYVISLLPNDLFFRPCYTRNQNQERSEKRDIYIEFRPAYDRLSTFKLLTLFKIPELIGLIRLPKKIQIMEGKGML